MAEEEEVRSEVEALQAVYGNDCYIIEEFLPHLTVQIRPRTADDSSQQFVEAVLRIQANAQEAVETLSNMNHPDGNCPLCLYPLVTEERHDDNFPPFMKLMSCFHCFHSECLVRWWKWLQEQNQTDTSNLMKTTVRASGDPENQRGTALVESSEVQHFLRQSQGNCPVCRKVFHTEDIEHVLDLLGTNSSQSILHGTDSDNDEKEFLWSEMENSRRQKFEAILKVQQENSGLIEPRRTNVLLPGMFLPQCSNPPVALMETTAESEEDEGRVCVPPSTEIDLGGPSDKTIDLGGPSDKTDMSDRNSRTNRKNRGHYTRKHSSQSGRKQWIKKEKDTC